MEPNFTPCQLTQCKVYAKLYTVSSGDPQTRKLIIDKTWYLLEKRKGQDVKISDIARAAGVSRQAVYLHFGSRAELLIATARHVDEMKHLDERLEAINKSTNGLEALESYIDFWGNYIPEIYGLAKALLAVRDTDEAAAAAWNDRMRDVYCGWQVVVDCLRRDGLLAAEWEPEQAADTLWAMTSIAVWENLVLERGWSTSEYVSRMKVALKRMLIEPQ
ncbi:MAG TPA: TetR/AcrR family transcriptional regulator [Anaerolineales bacterium]|nr:TetR/AcrR family transcriptional regulator [Anaerolineales bacterium]